MQVRTDSLRRLGTIAAAVALGALLVVMSACGSEPEKRDVADSSGLFHFKVPEEWQVLNEVGRITVYASDALPAEDESIDELSLLVLTSDSVVAAPVDEALPAFLADWAAGRGWSEVSTGTPRAVTVGERAATRVDVEAVGGNGQPFRGAYVWTRTSGYEVLVMAVTPPAEWDSYQDEISAVLEEWYWLRAEGSTEPSATP